MPDRRHDLTDWMRRNRGLIDDAGMGRRLSARNDVQKPHVRLELSGVVECAVQVPGDSRWYAPRAWAPTAAGAVEIMHRMTA